MTSSMIYSVAVASKIDRALYYSADKLQGYSANELQPAEQSLDVGALVQVPLGNRSVTGVILEKQLESESEIGNVSLRSIQKLMPKELWLTRELADLLVWSARYYHQPLGKVLSSILPSALLRPSHQSQKAHLHWQISDSHSDQQVVAILSRAPRQKALFIWLAENPVASEQEIKDAGFDRNLVKQLAEKALIYSTTGTVPTAESPRPAELRETLPTLTAEQTNALDEVRGCSDKPCLLDGVTGSGKTEVYLQAAEDCLRQNQQALILVPEIGLIQQMKRSLEQRFDTNLFVYSSETNRTDKLAAWRAARLGEPALYVGTRSSIFLPFTDLGLIVVDEEHDLSYKQQEGFRYHARDLATLRARELGARLILGSATPSLESFKNVQLGVYRHLKLSNRVNQTQLPDIHLQPTRANASGAISQESLDEIAMALSQDSQVLVFVNRRGYAPRTGCTNCGWTALCPRCDTTLCRHLTPPQLLCHHCDYRESIPGSCPQCHSKQLSHQGFGTEKLEKALQSRFPEIPCIRIDRDTTRRKGSFKMHIDSASSSGACILIGTQMLAKGHHLPSLSLAVICDADQGLFSHDYRAAEHLAQLVVQVAGRTGRSNTGGKLIIESEHSEHPLWNKLIESTYEQFAQQLMATRKQEQLPPYSYAAILHADCRNLPKLIQFMELAKISVTGFHHQVDIIGPMPASMEKRKDRFRYQLRFASDQRKALHQLLSALTSQLNAAKKMSAVRWGIDVDPQTLD